MAKYKLLHIDKPDEMYVLFFYLNDDENARILWICSYIGTFVKCPTFSSLHPQENVITIFPFPDFYVRVRR